MSETIHIKLPDGSKKEMPKGTTALDVAKSISPRLADAAIAAKARPLDSESGNDSGSQNQKQSDKNVRPTQASSTQAESNGDLIDLTRPLEKDTELRIL